MELHMAAAVWHQGQWQAAARLDLRNTSGWMKLLYAPLAAAHLFGARPHTYADYAAANPKAVFTVKNPIVVADSGVVAAQYAGKRLRLVRPQIIKLPPPHHPIALTTVPHHMRQYVGPLTMCNLRFTQLCMMPGCNAPSQMGMLCFAHGMTDPV